MVHSDAFRRMWSTTFRGAIDCRNMFITEITIIDNTVQRNLPVYLQTLKNMTYSLNCISVLLCTQSVHFVWAVRMGLSSLAHFHSTSCFFSK